MEEKGYKIRIMEDSAILGNRLKTLESGPMAGLKKIRTAKNASVRTHLFVQNNEDLKKEYTKTEDHNE